LFRESSRVLTRLTLTEERVKNGRMTDLTRELRSSMWVVRALEKAPGRPQRVSSDDEEFGESPLLGDGVDATLAELLDGQAATDNEECRDEGKFFEDMSSDDAERAEFEKRSSRFCFAAGSQRRASTGSR
jgi:hypothetical protein